MNYAIKYGNIIALGAVFGFDRRTERGKKHVVGSSTLKRKQKINDKTNNTANLAFAA